MPIFFNEIDELSLLIQQVYFLMKQTLYYTMKVYHLVSQQDSSSPRASLCPFASENEQTSGELESWRLPQLYTLTVLYIPI